MERAWLFAAPGVLCTGWKDAWLGALMCWCGLGSGESLHSLF